MNGERGAKGGKNDRVRALKITQTQKETIEKKERLTKEELKKIEANVRKRQIINFITVIPVVFFGGIFYTFQSKKRKEREIFAKPKKDPEVSPGDLIYNELELINDRLTKENSKKQPEIEILDEVEEKKKSTKKEENKVEKKESKKQEEKELEEEIAKIKSKKILEEYQNRIKELRYQLRNYYFEESILDEAKDIENNVPSEENLEKLNKLIDKLEKLKRKVEKESKLDIEDPYITYLVERDLDKIENNIELETIENAALYTTISDKIDEIKQVETKMEEKVETKKQEKNIDEEKLTSMKENYQKKDNFQKELDKFLQEQNANLVNVQNSIKNSVNKISMNRIQLNGLQQSTKLMQKRLKKLMKTPGPTSGKKITTMITQFLAFFGLINKPTKPQQLPKIEVQDFSEEIENNIKDVDNILSEIGKSSNAIDNTIREFISKYQEFSSTKEFQEILQNLEKIRQDLAEKEYEMLRIKKQQQKELEKNNAKIKTIYTK